MTDTPSPLWTTRTTEINNTGTWRSLLPDYRSTPSPCHNACPVHGNIAVWIQQLKAKDYHSAWLTLMENNPFPAIAGRICHHPCEIPCNRRELDEPVAICDLERFIGDIALDEGWAVPETALTRKERIAVIGGGPSGLSAAYQLRRRGYAITLFEARDRLGGLMRYGIPAYRLSRAVLDAEIQRIVETGVQVRTGSGFIDLDAVISMREEFDAVYLAIGAGISRRLPGMDYSRPRVIDSADYLAAANSGEPIETGQHIVVVGGGSAAMDVARTARRLGRQVSVLSLEQEAQMPAQREEVQEALEEAVTLIDGTMLKSVIADVAGMLELECVRVEFEPGTGNGEFQITPVEGTEFRLNADAVVTAIGQQVELEQWSALSSGNSPVIDIDTSCRTAIKGVFAGGDFTTLDRFVTRAVGMGKHAAGGIEAYLGGKSTAVTEQKTVPYRAINTWYHPQGKRERQNSIAPEERLKGFAEAQHGLTVAQALAEADRCFSCGNCIFCDNCYFYCPDMAITRLENGYEVKTDFCKGCGLCAAECPTGTIVMQEEC